MSFTETTTTSWLSRMKGAVGRIFFGIILVIATTVLLFWNEGRAIKTYRALVEGAGLVVSVDSASVDSANDGKLVHISGPVKPLTTPQDDTYGIAAENALRVVREVEMYQWVEKSESKTEKNVGGSEQTTTTYTYSKQWRTDTVDSSDFKQPGGHENPSRPIDGETFTVEKAAVGAFTLDGSDVAALGSSKRIPLGQEQANAFQTSLGMNVRPQNGELYAGSNPSSPAIGDLRIRYERVDLSEASFVGGQHGDRLSGFTVSNGREIFLSAAGRQSAAEMFETAQTENNIITWIVRVAGLLGMFIGFACFLSIFGVIGDVIPFVGSIVSFGTTLLAAVATLILGPIVIAIGWIAYRPILAISIIVGGLVIAFLFIRLRRKQPQTAPLGRPAS
ncbi:MAG: hypothetical protein BGN83_20515 [Rhizobium sp. 63-7]|nr:MAG: hypothetical protein BGN83_20515 [Rhizobium sp. 63-7]